MPFKKSLPRLWSWLNFPLVENLLVLSSERRPNVEQRLETGVPVVWCKPAVVRHVWKHSIVTSFWRPATPSSPSFLLPVRCSSQVPKIHTAVLNKTSDTLTPWLMGQKELPLRRRRRATRRAHALSLLHKLMKKLVWSWLRGPKLLKDSAILHRSTFVILFFLNAWVYKPKL